MFKIIHPKNKELYRLELMQFLEKRQKDALPADKLVYDHQASVYVTCQDSHCALGGGLRLNPMNTPNLVSDMLKDAVKTYEQPSIWECSALSLCVSAEADANKVSVPQKVCLCYDHIAQGLQAACAYFQISLIVFYHLTAYLEMLVRKGGVTFLQTIPVGRDDLMLGLFQPKGA
jgi:N-acyl-L-homoserine lactone synthetase